MKKALKTAPLVITVILILSTPLMVFAQRAVPSSFEVVKNEGIFFSASSASDKTWFVGQDGTILLRDGQNWSYQQSGTTETLNGVAAFDPTHVWAVGSNGTILFYDGNAWSKQQSGAGVELNSVCVSNKGEVWACGWEGTVLSNEGSGWTLKRTGKETLRGITETVDDIIWTVGSCGFVASYDGEWKEYKNDLNYVELYSVFADGKKVWACGTAGTVLHYNGSWDIARKGDEVLRGISVKDNEVWAVGYVTSDLNPSPGGVVIHYKGSWEKMRPDRRVYPTSVSSDGVWVAGLGGIMERK